MKKLFKKKFFLFTGFFLILVIILISPALVRETSKPGFCNSCHIMEKEYEDWFKTGLHRNIKCVDCHLPNDNLINHLIWKGIDGTKDVVSFYGRLYPDLIKISEHGKKTVKENCIRCHDEMVSRMRVEGRDCWACHRQTKHTFPGRGIGD